MKLPTIAMPLFCAGLALLAACPSSTPGATGDETGTDTGSDADATTPTDTVPTASDPTADESESGTADASGTTPTGSTDTTSPTSVETTSPTGCAGAEDCDNGVFCDGAEDCLDGECVPGEAPDCIDAAECTMDYCDLELDECVNDPSNEMCACGETCDSELGCGNHCVETECVNSVYQCGNCIDDDGDCTIDSADSDCWGPCDNNESGWSGNVPGQQNQSTCLAMDCYFDFDSGSGNDECYWSHSCDMLEPSACVYSANHNVPGTPSTCAELEDEQTATCEAYCGPLTPNGCDCFGCCDVTLADETVVTVYLGTMDANGVGTCDLEAVEDPTLCHPCTQVPACLNTCEECELCLGQLELPPECEEQVCPRDLIACGLPGQDPCPEGQACVTGCCVPNPQ